MKIKLEIEVRDTPNSPEVAAELLREIADQVKDAGTLATGGTIERQRNGVLTVANWSMSYFTKLGNIK